MFLNLILLAAALLQEPRELPRLEVGTSIEGEITDEAHEVHTPTLDGGNYVGKPTLGSMYRIQVERSGPYYVDLHSHCFDAYMVLRDANETIVAEDDDGLILSHARIVIELEASVEYRLSACALHGSRGPYELILRPGGPPMMAVEERRAAEDADSQAQLELLERMHGPSSLELALALHNASNTLQKSGRFAEADPLCRRALTIRERALGTEHLDVAESVSLLGHLHRAQGRYTEAELLYGRALKIREQALGPEHPDVGTSLNNLGGLLQELGRFAEARALHERALTILEQELGSAHPKVAHALDNLADLYRGQGHYAEAEPLCRRALAIKEQALPPEDPLIANSLNILAMLLSAQGRYAAAEPLLERALAIWEHSLGPEHPDVASGLSNLAGSHSSQGRFTEAEALLARALAIQEGALGQDHPAVAISLNNLAWVIGQQGRYADAVPLQERALEIYERVFGPEHRNVAVVLGNLARLYASQGLRIEAVRLYERALAIQEHVLDLEHLETADNLDGLGALYAAELRYADAAPMFERALAIYERALGREHAHVATSLNNLATVYRDQGRYSEAEPLFVRALAIDEKVFGPEHPTLATGLFHLADLYKRQSRYAQAEPLYRRSLAMSEKLFGSEYAGSSHSLNHLAAVHVHQGHVAEAQPLFKLALKRLVGYLDRELPVMSEADRFRMLALGNGPGLLLANTLRLEADDFAGVYDLCLQWKGKATRLQTASLALLLNQEDSGMRRRIGLLKTLQKQLSALVFLSRGEQTEDHAERIAELRGERLELERQLNRDLGLAELLATPSSKVVQAAIPENGVIVDFYADQELHAWVLRPDAEPALVTLGSVKDLNLRERQRAVLTPLVMRGKTPEMDSSPSQSAYESIWAPLAELVGNSELVFVSPSGFLNELPFGILRDGNGKFLLEKHRFIYLSDATRIVARGKPGADQAHSALVVGNVDYGDRGDQPSRATVAVALRLSKGRIYAALPGTAQEIETISRLFARSASGDVGLTRLTGADANEERVRQMMVGKRFVHVATHGYFEPDGLPSLMRDADKDQAKGPSDELVDSVGLLPGLLTGLVLAGVNAEPDPERDDGFLSAEEIQFLDLSACDLAVLSGCETALGSVRAGEGLMSLRRAFEVAGAKTVVSSLWKVEDRATATLMGHFYENYWLKGRGKSKALHAARLRMLEENRSSRNGDSRPETWGAFVLSGDWQ